MKCRQIPPISSLSGLTVDLCVLFCSNESDHVKHVSVVYLSLAGQVMLVPWRGYLVGGKGSPASVRWDCFRVGWKVSICDCDRSR
jgi:hypothetical protein